MQGKQIQTSRVTEPIPSDKTYPGATKIFFWG